VPAFLEKALARSGKKHGFKGERLKHYIYGSMNNIGAMHGNQETEKGAEMDAKHKAKLFHRAAARSR